MNKIEFQNKVLALSNADFSKNKLIVSVDNFVEVKPRNDLAIVTPKENLRLISRMEREAWDAFKKIQTTLNEHSDFIDNKKTIKNLFKFLDNTNWIIDRLRANNRNKFDHKLKKIELIAIRQFLLNKCAGLSIEEGEAYLKRTFAGFKSSDWISVAKKSFRKEYTISNHPAFRNFSHQEANILKFYEPGAYLLSSDDLSNSEFILYYQNAEGLQSLPLVRTIGKFAYQTFEEEIACETLEELIIKLQKKEIIEPQLKMIPIHEAFSSKLDRLSSCVKGWKTRRAVVLPRQIISFLDNHLEDKENLEFATKSLCREINNMTLNPQIYKGKCHKLNPFTRYLFPNEAQPGTSFEVKLNFDCWLEMSDDCAQVRLLIVPLQNAFIGEGARKKVYKAHSFEIPLSLTNKQRSYSYHNRAVHRIRKYRGGSRVHNVDIVSRSHHNLQLLLEKIKPGAKLMGVPRWLPNTNPLMERSTEFEEEWCNDNLHDAIKFSDNTLDFDTTVRSSLLDKLAVLKDITNTVKLIHEAGFVHGDIKPYNMLIKVDKEDKDSQPEGILTDFDFLNYAGTKSQGDKRNYYYWDTCTLKGLYFTPFTDVHGLAMSLCEIFSIDCLKMKHLFKNEDLAGYDTYREELIQKNPERKKALEIVFDLMVDILHSDKQKYEFMLQSEHIRPLFQSKETRSEGVRGLEIVESFTASDFLAKLNKIEQALTNSSIEIVSL